MPSESSLTIPIYFVKAVLKNIPSESNDWLRLLNDAHINTGLLNDTEGLARVSIEQFARLKANAMIYLNDEMLGYGPKPLKIGSWKMMCYACISAETLGEVINRHSFFYNLLDCGMHTEIKLENNNAVYALTESVNHPFDPFVYEFCLHNTYRLFSWFIERNLPLSRINLSFAKPQNKVAYSMLGTNIPVYFNQANSGFEFQQQTLSLPVAQNNMSLRKYLHHPVYELMIASYEELSWSAKTQKLIGKNIVDAPPFENIAEQLIIHPQTLRRRLAEEGTTYRDIKNNLRRDTSIYYLAKPDLSIEQVAERSGFSESSSFVRAFKTWTGLTPNNYRKESNKADE